MGIIKRCESCQGKKTIMGVGMIEKKCSTCSGIGWLSEGEQEIPKIIPVTHKKKRGRKPQNVLQCESE